MAWQPNPESLGQLAACLKDSLSGFNKAAQKQAEIVRFSPLFYSKFSQLPSRLRRGLSRYSAYLYRRLSYAY